MKTILGNLLDQTPGLLCHQVNCLGVMGAGLALQIRERWPQVFNEYRRFCSDKNFDDLSLLADVQFVESVRGVHVANIFGQSNIGYQGCQTSYRSYPAALSKVREYARDNNLPVYIPHGIGCGIAGGNWNHMKAILEEHLPEATVVRYLEGGPEVYLMKTTLNADYGALERK